MCCVSRIFYMTSTVSFLGAYTFDLACDYEILQFESSL